MIKNSRQKFVLIHDENQNVKKDFNSENCENYHQSQKLIYFNFDYNYDDFGNFQTIVLTFTTTMEFFCRRCICNFTFNNQL